MAAETTWVSDADWAFRTYLRATLGPTIGVWSAKPKGTPSFPMIIINGRLGGGPEPGIPMDNPRLSFDVWGEASGNGRRQAVVAMKALVGALGDLDNEMLDPETYGFGAYDISVRWLPDESDPDNVLPRYVVDASMTLRSP